MEINIRLPQVTGGSVEKQIAQLQSYMYQMVEQLNYALNAIGSSSEEKTEIVTTEKGSEISPEEAQKNFDSIKALIIKSADIVRAYYDQMKVSFDGEYAAQSDFGSFSESTNQTITANSASITQLFSNLQTISETVDMIKETRAWIKSGELDTGIYGVEVGQTIEQDGVETFNKYARFTADGIYFFLPGYSTAVAWMTGTKLFISNAAIQGKLTIGNYEIDSSNGITFKWIGGVS